MRGTVVPRIVSTMLLSERLFRRAASARRRRRGAAGTARPPHEERTAPMAEATLRHKLFVTACAITGTTNLAARWCGAAPFLPKLFVLRYANMGGLHPPDFAQELRAARSFRDDRWCAHWDRIAEQHAERAVALLRDLAKTESCAVPAIGGPVTLTEEQVAALTDLISPGAVLFADNGPQPSEAAIIELVDRYAQADDRRRTARAFRAIDAWTKAITYYQVSAFPGHSARRMQAYWRSRHLFDALVAAIAPAIDLRVERLAIPTPDGDTVRGWLTLAPGHGPQPVVLTTNGLEGTVAELAVGLLRYRAAGLAMFMMEMPGTYAYAKPMGPQSERTYRRVIDHLAADPRLDPDRIAMVGVSFGGYWAARMAANDDRLACAVACGAPTHHSFNGGALGIPHIIISALADTLGATNPIKLARALRALSIRDRLPHITIPLLAINGEHDTLLSTQDTVDLADTAPNATLLLYPDDDHCAMGHYRQWLDHSQEWLRKHLVPADGAASEDLDIGR
ncbi:alpha/beta hydrolase family protein [Mycobacterium sp. E2462]|uniref:alpha/beta hydrolase family protein n=1 Tax=Mycobacterium sp. E2462 TaxID=1834133 RepID=UPI0035158AC0